MSNGQRYADFPPQSGGRTLFRPPLAPQLLSEPGMKVTKVENPFSPFKTSPIYQNCFVQALAKPHPVPALQQPLPTFSKAKSAQLILIVLTNTYLLLSPHPHQLRLLPLPTRILLLHLMHLLTLPPSPPRGARLRAMQRLDFVSDVGMSVCLSLCHS